MGKKNVFLFCAYLSLVLLFFVVVLHLNFVVLPVIFLALGFLSYLWSGRKALLIFLFLLPLINSSPDIFFNGYPFNYMGVALFYLSGMMIASHLKKEKTEFIFPGFGFYLLLLLMIAMSVFFVFLRWSNVTISHLSFLRDTPVTPSGERVSFAAIFPIITMALFSLTPFLAAVIRHWRLEAKEIFFPLKAGFCLSFLLALVQKWLNPDFLAQSWWGLRMNQVNGGFSDFNAFGFFAGVMFLYQALQLTEKFFRRNGLAANKQTEHSNRAAGQPVFREWCFEILFFVIALTAIFVSGCRTAFLFVMLAVGYVIFSKKTNWRAKALVVLLIVGSLLAAGGTLKRRLQDSFAQTMKISRAEDRLQAINNLSSGRLYKLRDSWRMIGRFPVSGVGAGNFLFYLKYLHFIDTAFMDLPLNQYLLVSSEIGLPAGLCFMLFLAALLKRKKKGPRHYVMASIAFALLFNNFFWFPECLLLFWIFLAGEEYQDAPVKKLKPIVPWAVMAFYFLFQVLDFQPLHPVRLTNQYGVAYDYGFWPPEKNERGDFSWTRGAAGKYFTSADVREISIFCEAPHEWLQKEKMTVDLFWRGEFLQQVVFVANELKKIQLPLGQEGFLDIRVHPTFNIHTLHLGDDDRELGVQLLETGTVLK